MKGIREGGLSEILHRRPCCRTSPEEVKHDVLQWGIVIIGESYPRSVKSMEAMASRWDIKASEYSLHRAS